VQEHLLDVVAPHPQGEQAEPEVGRGRLLLDIGEGGDLVEPQQRAPEVLQSPEEVEEPARKGQVGREQHPHPDGERVEREPRAGQGAPGVALEQALHVGVVLHDAHFDLGDNREEPVQSIDRIHDRGEGKADPEVAVAEDARPLAGHLQRHVGNRVCQLLAIHPAAPQDHIEAQHLEQQHHDERAPDKHRLAPADDPVPAVHRRAAAEGALIDVLIGEEQEARQVRLEEVGPLVLGGRALEGADDLGCEHLNRVMPRERGADPEHDVHDDQLVAV
jgi:hypothetical protein